jgi:hypothetical protein
MEPDQQVLQSLFHNDLKQAGAAPLDCDSACGFMSDGVEN